MIISAQQRSGNPIAEGWYADPEAVVMDGRYWVFPTYSAEYDKQLHFDAFSSKDLVCSPAKTSAGRAVRCGRRQ